LVYLFWIKAENLFLAVPKPVFYFFGKITIDLERV